MRPFAAAIIHHASFESLAFAYKHTHGQLGAWDALAMKAKIYLRTYDYHRNGPNYYDSKPSIG
jgi:hypothetical protein